MAKKKKKVEEEFDDEFDEDDDFEDDLDEDKEEDDFDDEYDDEFDEDDDEKPKKKKDSKVLLWIVAFAVVLAILLFIRFNQSPAETPNDNMEVEDQPPVEVEERYVPEDDQSDEGNEYIEAGTYVEPKDAGPDVVERDDLPNVREVIDTTHQPELFSNVQCNYDYDSEQLQISLRVYNVLDEDIKISPRGVQKGYNTYFLIRGLVDQDPGCGTELLKPNEWTECRRIGFDVDRFGNTEGTNRISVQVPGITEALIVSCPEKPDRE